MCTNCVNFIWVLEITQKLPSHFWRGRTICRWLYCLSRVTVKICCGAVTSIIYLYLTSPLTSTAAFVALLCGRINLHHICSENLGLVTSCGLTCQFIELVVVSWFTNIVARFFFPGISAGEMHAFPVVIIWQRGYCLPQQTLADVFRSFLSLQLTLFHCYGSGAMSRFFTQAMENTAPTLSGNWKNCLWRTSLITSTRER